MRPDPLQGDTLLRITPMADTRFLDPYVGTWTAEETTVQIAGHFDPNLTWFGDVKVIYASGIAFPGIEEDEKEVTHVVVSLAPDKSLDDRLGYTSAPHKWVIPARRLNVPYVLPISRARNKPNAELREYVEGQEFALSDLGDLADQASLFIRHVGHVCPSDAIYVESHFRGRRVALFNGTIASLIAQQCANIERYREMFDGRVARGEVEVWPMAPFTTDRVPDDRYTRFLLSARHDIDFSRSCLAYLDSVKP